MSSSYSYGSAGSGNRSPHNGYAIEKELVVYIQFRVVQSYNGTLAGNPCGCHVKCRGCNIKSCTAIHSSLAIGEGIVSQYSINSGGRLDSEGDSRSCSGDSIQVKDSIQNKDVIYIQF